MKLIARVVWALVALGASSTLVASRLLTPSPSGVGTHLALGLPPCGFLAWSGLPCPGCGLTTSFAHLAHGHLLEALHANALGVPLFAITLALVPAAVCFAVRGDSPFAIVDRYQLDRAATLIVIAMLASWVVRLSTLALS